MCNAHSVYGELFKYQRHLIAWIYRSFGRRITYWNQSVFLLFKNDPFLKRSPLDSVYKDIFLLFFKKKKVFKIFHFAFFISIGSLVRESISLSIRQVESYQVYVRYIFSFFRAFQYLSLIISNNNERNLKNQVSVKLTLEDELHPNSPYKASWMHSP